MDAFLHDGKNYILHFSFMQKVGDTDLIPLNGCGFVSSRM